MFTQYHNEKQLRSYMQILAATNQLEQWAYGLSAEDFLKESDLLRSKLVHKPVDILPAACALTREAARRCLGERLYDVQILAALALYFGNIMEMKTGEGKTISSVAAIYVHALTGRGVHVVTVNDYLAKRDAEWMSPVFAYLGISVGYIQGNMETALRKVAYAKDVTYGTNNEFGFDYLRDNMCYSIEDKTQREHNYCVIDEIDSILIDEARTPLIISGPAEDNTAKYQFAHASVQHLKAAVNVEDTPEGSEPDGDYVLTEKNKRVSFTSQGIKNLETKLNQIKAISGSIFDEQFFEYIHHATQALRAQKFFRKDTEYVVRDKKIEIVDEFTGRILHGRRYSEGLHQAIEAKEGIRIARRNRTLATITLQNYFRMYNLIAGMTGTAATEAKEFAKIYNLNVVTIPTNRPIARNDEQDRIYGTKQAKYEAICQEVESVHAKGQPILIGTVSIENSEELSKSLKRRGIRHNILNAKHHESEAQIISEAGAAGAVTIATNMAGRGTDIKLGGNNEEKQAQSSENSYEMVQGSGGLCVIGTERHEARRIDNQLRGRSGRQGDPGRSVFFLSLDDELMRLFGSRTESIKQMMNRGLEPGQSLNHPLITKSIERAQRRVEDRNFETRKHLLEFDDVLNKQRGIIYQQRVQIMAETDLHARISKILEDVVNELASPLHNDKDTMPQVLETIKQQFLYTASIPTPATGQASEIIAAIIEHFEKELRVRREQFGNEIWNSILRMEYLRNIDKMWLAHLEQLDELQEAVYLRSYAQKNPLLEYKLEGFRLFDSLIDAIRTATLQRILRIEIKENMQNGRMLATGTAMQQRFNNMQAQQQNREQPAALVRQQKKVGRNDPCPCGSKKKYKHCCGR